MALPTPANGNKRARPGRRLSLRQVLDLQEITHEMAVGLRGDFNASSDREERARVAGAVANLSKALVSLQDSKREILGKPKAGVLKPEDPKSKRGRRPMVWEIPEPIEPEDVPCEPEAKGCEAPQPVAASAPPPAPKPTPAPAPVAKNPASSAPPAQPARPLASVFSAEALAGALRPF